MRRAVPLVLLGLLAGCTDHLAARQAYLSQFVGQPELALVQAMGVPTRSIETGGVKYLAYDEHRIDIIPGTPGYGAFNMGWYGGAGFPPQVIQMNCETTFEVVDGKVRTFNLRGNACG